MQPGAISDPAALNGRLAIADIYPGAQLTLNNFTAEASGALNAQIAGRERGVTLTIDAVKGSLANVASGDHVDIYTQVDARGRTVIQLFRVERRSSSQAPGAAGRQRRAQGRHQGRVERPVRGDPDDPVLRHPPGIGSRADGADRSPTSRP